MPPEVRKSNSPIQQASNAYEWIERRSRKPLELPVAYHGRVACVVSSHRVLKYNVVARVGDGLTRDLPSRWSFRRWFNPKQDGGGALRNVREFTGVLPRRRARSTACASIRVIVRRPGPRKLSITSSPKQNRHLVGQQHNGPIKLGRNARVLAKMVDKYSDRVNFPGAGQVHR